MNRCIYCNAENNLSKSDVIPDALTNGKILNPNVCQIQHNNKFSDEFESKVIHDLAFITDFLCINSSKRKNKKIPYVGYDSKIMFENSNELAGDFYLKNACLEDFLNGNKMIYKKNENTELIGNFKILNKHNNKDKIKKIDLSKVEIIQKNEIDYSIFISEEIKRMVAKIAFEWFALKNDVCQKENEFTEIINYISTGKIEENRVNLIIDDELYSIIHNYFSPLGNHCLISYVKDCKINIIVNLFGVIIYNVELCKVELKFPNNVLFHEIDIDGNQQEFIYKNINDLKSKVQNSFQEVKSNTMKLLIPINIENDLLEKEMRYLLYFTNVDSLKMYDGNNSLKIISNKICELLNTYFCTKYTLKRFVNDLENCEFILNPYGTNKSQIFNSFVVYFIGRSSDIFSYNQFRKALPEIKILLQKNHKKILNEILEDISYKNCLKIGSEKIKKW